LAVGTQQRISALPDVPTVAECGYKDFETVQWYGLNVRSGTPPEIVTKLQRECFKALSAPELASRFESESAVTGGGPSVEYARFIQKEQARWKEVVTRAQIKPA
jgi:tripartite-type tricarboxylate transporter receptor subunit TctC